ncbi:hypothetical protein ACFQ2B_15060 [Streptomyces stramineus]
MTEELAALHAAWRAATEADANPARPGSDLAYWHQMWLWPTIERIRQHYMFSECETDHATDRPGRPTDEAALKARMAEAAAERDRQENARYTFFAEALTADAAERPDALWRHAGAVGAGAGGAWEFLSSWTGSGTPPRTSRRATACTRYRPSAPPRWPPTGRAG